MTQIEAGGGLTLTVRGDWRLGRKRDALQMGDARCTWQRINSGCGGWGLFIWMRSGDADGIFF